MDNRSLHIADPEIHRAMNNAQLKKDRTNWWIGFFLFSLVVVTVLGMVIRSMSAAGWR